MSRTSLAKMEVADVRPIGARDRAEDDRRFRAAARHSARVRFLRVAIPASIVVMLGLIVVAVFFNPLRVLARLPIDPGSIMISGTRVTMEAPRLAGFTRDARAYEMTARSASQDLTKPDLLDLTDIRAKVELQDKEAIEITAANGVYDRKADRLTLTDRIRLTSSSGYDARLTRAVVNVKTGNIVSPQPVEVTFLNGTLNAHRLEIDEKGDYVRFDGGVAMILMLNTAGDGPAAQ